MKLRMSYKFPIKLALKVRTDAQKLAGDPLTKFEEFLKWSAAANKYYNHCLAVENTVSRRPKEDRKFLFRSDLHKLVQSWRRLGGDYAWTRSVPVMVLRSGPAAMESGMKAFFKARREGNNETRFPSYRSGRVRTIQFEGVSCKIEGNTISFPKARASSEELGPFRFFKSRDIVGDVKTATVKLEHGKLWLCLSVAQEVDEPVHPNEGSKIGVDLGIVRHATMSNGTFFPTLLPLLEPFQKKLKSAQRKLARQKQQHKIGTTISKAQIAQRRVIGRLHEKIANVRKHHLHERSKELTDEFETVAVEDLRVKEMTASASGTVEAPGKGVKAKSSLNRRMLDHAPAAFRFMLEYKAARKGGKVIAVDPAYTSRTCSRCWHQEKSNRQGVKFRCLNCGFKIHADKNAAINILAKAVKAKVIKSKRRTLVK